MVDRIETGLQKSDLLRHEQSHTLFEDSYHRVGNFVKERPLEAGAAGLAILGTGFALSYMLRRASTASLEGALQTALNGTERSTLAGAKAAGTDVFKAGTGALTTLEGKVIPNLERPFLNGGVANGLSDATREAYAGDLVKLWTMPKTVALQTGEDLANFSERILRDRAALTGERINEGSIAKELSRISELNTGVATSAELGGRQLVVSNEAHFVRAAEELQFKHVPQIGQFLKGTGKISEEQIEAALKIQRAIPPEAPRKLLGEILVENKLAAQADVDSAFASQQDWKAQLKTLREKFISNVSGK